MKPAHVRASRIDAPVRRLSGATMGTGWSLSFAAADSITNTAVIAALEETFALVIQQMSNWEPGSDLSRFNRETGWHDLKPDFMTVLSRALAIAQLTGGAYDPTLGARMDMLGFGPSVHPGESQAPEPHAPAMPAAPGWVIPRPHRRAGRRLLFLTRCPTSSSSWMSWLI